MNVNENTLTFPKESEHTAAELESVYQRLEFTDIKFWVPPSVVTSQQECEAQVLKALENIQNGKRLRDLSQERL